jgi:hypothetical protein
MQVYEFTVVIERDEDGRFVAVVPALQGEGDTEQEARRYRGPAGDRACRSWPWVHRIP